MSPTEPLTMSSQPTASSSKESTMASMIQPAMSLMVTSQPIMVPMVSMTKSTSMSSLKQPAVVLMILTHPYALDKPFLPTNIPPVSNSTHREMTSIVSYQPSLSNSSSK